jgi:hypothetical protein
MSARIRVIERIENNVELLVPFDIEVRLLYVGMVCFDLDRLVEPACRFFRNLCAQH